MIDLPDGIYFDFPDEVYFAIERLSASGVQNLLVSPATFWANSWLNPKKAEALAGAAIGAMSLTAPAARPPYFSEIEAALLKAFPNAAKAESDPDATKARQLGKAYHVARLEPERLESRFCRQPDRSDYPETSKGGATLWTGKDIEAALGDLGEPKTKGGETVGEKGLRLESLGYGGIIYPLETARFEAELRGRTPIPAKYWDDMLTDMERLRSSPVAKLLTGGAAEVSVLWTDERGVRWKCRIDYLMSDAWTDLKTFDNKRGRVLEQALLDAFRFNRHYIQGGVYRDAVEMIRGGALEIIGPATERQKMLIGQVALSPTELQCWFVYQEKNGVPNILGRRMEFFDVPQGVKIQNTLIGAAEFASEEGIARVEAATRTKTFLYRKAREEISRAREDFINYQEIYEPGRPWAPWQPLRTWDDMDFPDYFLRTE